MIKKCFTQFSFIISRKEWEAGSYFSSWQNNTALTGKGVTDLFEWQDLYWSNLFEWQDLYKISWVSRHVSLHDYSKVELVFSLFSKGWEYARLIGLLFYHFWKLINIRFLGLLHCVSSIRKVSKLCEALIAVCFENLSFQGGLCKYSFELKGLKTRRPETIVNVARNKLFKWLVLPACMLSFNYGISVCCQRELSSLNQRHPLSTQDSTLANPHSTQLVCSNLHRSFLTSPHCQ